MWRASGITSELQLYTTAIGGLVLALACFFAGWFHYHKAAPKLEWFQNVESMLNHHLGGLIGLGSLGWAGHQIHVSLPINKLLDAGVDPKEIPLPHEFLLNKAILADLYPSFAKGLTPFFTLNWSDYSDFLTFKGGLNPVTGGLWLTDSAHHHLALAVLFLVAGHQYRTNWGIGHSTKEILEAHKGPFTGEGHVGLYEIFTTSWHAQLAVNLALFGSLSIIVACKMMGHVKLLYMLEQPASTIRSQLFVNCISSGPKLSCLVLSYTLFLREKGYVLAKQENLRNNLAGRANQQETKALFHTMYTLSARERVGSSETTRGELYLFKLIRRIKIVSSFFARLKKTFVLASPAAKRDTMLAPYLLSLAPSLSARVLVPALSLKVTVAPKVTQAPKAQALVCCFSNISYVSCAESLGAMKVTRAPKAQVLLKVKSSLYLSIVLDDFLTRSRLKSMLPFRLRRLCLRHVCGYQHKRWATFLKRLTRYKLRSCGTNCVEGRTRRRRRRPGESTEFSFSNQ